MSIANRNNEDEVIKFKEMSKASKEAMFFGTHKAVICLMPTQIILELFTLTNNSSSEFLPEIFPKIYFRKDQGLNWETFENKLCAIILSYSFTVALSEIIIPSTKGSTRSTD